MAPPAERKPSAALDLVLRGSVSVLAVAAFVALSLIRNPTLSPRHFATTLSFTLYDALGENALLPVILAGIVVDVYWMLFYRQLPIGRSAVGAPVLGRRLATWALAIAFAWLLFGPSLSFWHDKYLPWASATVIRSVRLGAMLVEGGIALAASRWGVANGFSLWLGARAALMLGILTQPEELWRNIAFEPIGFVLPVAALAAVLLVLVPVSGPSQGPPAPRVSRLVAGLWPLWLCFWHMRVCGEEWSDCRPRHLFLGLVRLAGLADFDEIRDNRGFTGYSAYFDWSYESWDIIAFGFALLALLTLLLGWVATPPGRLTRAWTSALGDRLPPRPLAALRWQWWGRAGVFFALMAGIGLSSTFQPRRFPAEWELFMVVASLLAVVADVAAEVRAKARRNDWTPIGSVQEMAMVPLVRTLLVEASIEHHIRSERHRSLFADFGGGLLPLIVSVPSAHAQRAREVCNSFVV
ncbi:MAG TPA: hypothetical protein VNG33_20640 [Polyangiaceae bacterium]|nr:hypothetical protein [Polyangiaceae bacterium]